MILSKQQILESKDLTRETVEVPEWGGSVIVQCMSGLDRDAWEQSHLDEDRKPMLDNARAKLVSRCLVDEAGNRLFSDSEVEALGRKSARALGRVARACERINGLGEKEGEQLKGN